MMVLNIRISAYKAFDARSKERGMGEEWHGININSCGGTKSGEPGIKPSKYRKQL